MRELKICIAVVFAIMVIAGLACIKMSGDCDRREDQ